MAEILIKWLNKEIGISPPLDKDSILTAFANGYLFGKILHKYNLQDDFNKFLNGTGADDTLNNFDRLQPKFKLLKVPCDINIATAIIFKKPGAALQTLYHLFTAVENAKKNGTSLTLLLINQPRAEAKKQECELPIFKDQLRRRLPRQAELQLQEINCHFEQIQRDNEEKARLLELEKVRQYKSKIHERRLIELDNAKTVRDYMKKMGDNYREAARAEKIEKQRRDKIDQEFQATKKAASQSKRSGDAAQVIALNHEQKRLSVVSGNSDSKTAETEDDSDDDEFHVLTSDLLKIESEKVTKEDKYREIRRKQYLFKEFKNIRERTDIQRSNQMINRVVRPCFHEQKIACFLKQTIDEKKAIVFARGEHNQRAEKNRIRSIKEEDERRRARAEAEKMFIQKSIDRVLKGRVDLAENETKEAEKKMAKMAEDALLSETSAEKKLAEYKELCKEVAVPKIIENEIVNNTDESDDLFVYDQTQASQVEQCNEVLEKLQCVRKMIKKYTN